MKIAFVADSHFDSHSRFAECVRLHDWIAEDARAQGVTLVCHAGDVFERKSNAEERAAVADWIAKVTSFAAVMIVRGNHDGPGCLPLFERLESDWPIWVEEGAGLHRLDGAAVAAVAWPSLATLGAASGASGAALEQTAHAALCDVLRGLGAELADVEPDLPRILLMHAMVDGSVTSHGQPLIGAELHVGLDDLALAGCDFIAIGHIHKGQEWTVGGVPVVYPGSPRRTSFGESEPKGYVIATFEGRQLVGWERREVPATPMVDVEATWKLGDLFLDRGSSDETPVIAGAEVRVRYAVTSDAREAAKAAAEEWRADLLARGAVSAKFEERVLAETRARQPEIAAATTLPAKLDALWAAKGVEPDAERRGRLMSKLAAVQETGR